MIILIISWIIFGGLVGLIARAVFPGRQSLGFFGTVALGIAGSFTGGILANLIFGGHIFAMHAAGWIGSIIGSLLVLALLSIVGSSRRRLAH